MLGYKSSACNEDLIGKVLRQGEALRAALTHSIVKNEPFFVEKQASLKHDSTASLIAHSLHKVDEDYNKEVELSLHMKHACIAYMNGDPMTKEEEKQALDTFRSLSGGDICDLTSRSFATTRNSCKCETCIAYCKMNNSLGSKKVPHLNLKQLKNADSVGSSERVKFVEKSSSIHNNYEVFQFINSLKIVIYSFSLSNEGKTKLMTQTTSLEKFENLFISYFIEYEIPAGISKVNRKQSKVDCGLNSASFIKKCSKNIIKNVVYFKQVTIHDVINLDVVNLEDVDVIFKISARIQRQKNSVPLGVSKFNFTEFFDSPTLSCLQEIPVFLSEDSPIVSGTIKIHLQLGCDRLYFGQEFIGCLCSRENKKIKLEDGKLNETFTLTNINNAPGKTKEIIKKAREPVISNVKGRLVNKSNGKTSPKRKPQTNNAQKDKNGIKIDQDVVATPNLIVPPEKTILFGFIFASNATFSQTIPCEKTYFTCQPFCQLDYICSNVTQQNYSANINYNYHQVIPYVYDDDFLFNLRENHMIIEFFSTQSSTYSGDEVIGICKIPLHQYYLAFRNPVVVKYLSRNNLPVIGTDWYEPVRDVASGETVGNVQILVALGLEEQVKNLQRERGFMDDIVRRDAGVVNKISGQIIGRKQLRSTRECEKVRRSTQNLNKKTDIIVLTDTDCIETHETISKVDKSTIVTPSLKESSNSLPCGNTETMADNSNKTDEDRLQAIQQYLHELVEIKAKSAIQHQQINNYQKHHTSEENQINNLNHSENDSNNSIRRSTSSLFESLQEVMNVDNTRNTSYNNHTFKAQVVVESALHLPARKKCRAKRVKGKIVREEMLPSTYVSYAIKDGVVKTSHVVQKNTSPEWFLKNDVNIPLDYLTNSNKRLLFKIWRKSNNGSTIPNMQIDTIIGFATVDLTVLLAGLPTIQGWFNIMDFGNKCNGQIKINVIPLEDVKKYNKLPSTTTTSYTTTPTVSTTINSATTASTPEISSSPDETFNRALKRKFIELEEISQRLKARLNHVTEDLPSEDDQDINDESADEFEKDINTLCVEEDYELLDFAKEAQDMNMRRVSTSLHEWQQNTQELLITTDDNHVNNDNTEKIQDELALQVVLESPDISPTNEEVMKPFVPQSHHESGELEPTSTSSSSACSLDRQLTEGKERIDHLLQRLTLLSTVQAKSSEFTENKAGIAGFTGRYVSGCSTSQDPARNVDLEQDILSELGIVKNFDAAKLLNDSLESFNGNLEEFLGRSLRDEPDGEGNSSELNAVDKIN